MCNLTGLKWTGPRCSSPPLLPSTSSKYSTRPGSPQWPGGWDYVPQRMDSTKETHLMQVSSQETRKTSSACDILLWVLWFTDLFFAPESLACAHKAFFSLRNAFKMEMEHKINKSRRNLILENSKTTKLYINSAKSGSFFYKSSLKNGSSQANPNKGFGF